MEEAKQVLYLTEEQLDEIAERAADKAIAKMETQLYVKIGKSVLTGLCYTIGLFVVALGTYLQSKGYINILGSK